MQLPAVTIPFELPFELPLMLHPIVVHFAVVLPIIVLVLELFNLGFKRKALSVASLGFLLLALVAYIAAYYTGKTDGKEAFALLSEEAQAELKFHRLLGTYLVYALLIPLVFKLLAMLLAQKWAKSVLILTLVLFISFVFKQGHDGGELVYEYGVNVQAAQHAQDALEEATETIDDLKDTLAGEQAKTAKLTEELEAYKAQEAQSFSHKVSEAVDSVQKMLGDDENGAEDEEGIIAVDEAPAEHHEPVSAEHDAGMSEAAHTSAAAEHDVPAASDVHGAHETEQPAQDPHSASDAGVHH